MVGAESTWVAKGVGYELVTRSKLEILPLMSQLDDQSRYFAKEFGADPARVIVAVRRVGPAGSVPEASAPVPFDAGPVVELVVLRPLQKGEKAAESDGQRGGRGGQSRGGAAQPGGDEPERFIAAGPTAPLVRAWLSARASSLTGKQAPPAAASATADDPRVPAWAEDGLPGLAVPTGREDTTTARLAMQVDSLYPIHSFLTMARPGAVASMARGGRGGRGGDGGAGRSPGGGVRGGMGGMGGRRGGSGVMPNGSTRGGNVGQGYPRDGATGPYRVFSGNTLFAAQALLFGRYLTVREGPAFVGSLVDAQIQAKSVNDLFAKAEMVPRDLERLDIEFHRWLIDRAAHGR